MKAKNFALGALFVAAVLLVSSSAWAGKRPNPYRGKTVYIASCKVCHVKDGGAAVLTPMSKTQGQWDRFFENEKKLGACVDRAAEKTGTKLTEQDLANMRFFLWSHAADSDQPETCGQ